MSDEIPAGAPVTKKRPSSKAIGTAGETAVKRFLQLYWPEARRVALAGSADEGDIGGCGRFVFEVKAGKQTAQIGDRQLAAWMLEAEIEAKNAGVDFGILVIRRAGVGVGQAYRWWAYVPLPLLAEWLGASYHSESTLPVRLELGALVQMLAEKGYV